jgi:hypothetical protein
MGMRPTCRDYIFVGQPLNLIKSALIKCDYVVGKCSLGVMKREVNPVITFNYNIVPHFPTPVFGPNE